MAMTAEKGPEEDADELLPAADGLLSVGVDGASEVSRFTRFVEDIKEGAAFED